MLNWSHLLEFDSNSNTFVVLIRLNFRHKLVRPYIEIKFKKISGQRESNQGSRPRRRRFICLPDKDVTFLQPLMMESFALEPVGIFQFYLTLLLRISEELRQKRP